MAVLNVAGNLISTWDKQEILGQWDLFHMLQLYQVFLFHRKGEEATAHRWAVAGAAGVSPSHSSLLALLGLLGSSACLWSFASPAYILLHSCACIAKETLNGRVNIQHRGGIIF